MPRALKIDGFRIRLIDVGNTLPELQTAVGGKIEAIAIRDGGAMICDREALPKDKPYNNLASLVAGTGIYGEALIVGENGDSFSDVPDPFIALLNFPEDYFNDSET